MQREISAIENICAIGGRGEEEPERALPFYSEATTHWTWNSARPEYDEHKDIDDANKGTVVNARELEDWSSEPNMQRVGSIGIPCDDSVPSWIPSEERRYWTNSSVLPDYTFTDGAKAKDGMRDRRARNFAFDALIERGRRALRSMLPIHAKGTRARGMGSSFGSRAAACRASHTCFPSLRCRFTRRRAQCNPYGCFSPTQADSHSDRDIDSTDSNVTRRIPSKRKSMPYPPHAGPAKFPRSSLHPCDATKRFSSISSSVTLAVDSSRNVSSLHTSNCYDSPLDNVFEWAILRPWRLEHTLFLKRWGNIVMEKHFRPSDDFPRGYVRIPVNYLDDLLGLLTLE